MSKPRSRTRLSTPAAGSTGCRYSRILVPLRMPHGSGGTSTRCTARRHPSWPRSS